MENKALNNLLTMVKEGFDENLPSILTAGSVVTMIATAGYAVYAGWKIKEIADDKELETKTKVKRIAFLSLPIAGGAAVSGACAIGANKQNKERYAALTALVATGASAVNKEEIGEKVSEITGKKQKKHKAFVDQPVNENETITVTDSITGYKFTTTLADFWRSQRLFNEMVSCNAENYSLSCFYEELLGDRYIKPDIHDDITFGTDWEGKTVLFNPEFDVELDGNMKPQYTISYDYKK